jgi:hypothetical protein
MSKSSAKPNQPGSGSQGEPFLVQLQSPPSGKAIAAKSQEGVRCTLPVYAFCGVAPIVRLGMTARGLRLRGRRDTFLMLLEDVAKLYGQDDTMSVIGKYLFP